MAYREWDPETALRRLAEEKTVLSEGKGDPVSTSEAILKESAPEVALSICWMALHSLDERMRLNASKYVLDRVLPELAKTGGFDPIMDLYEKLAANDAQP